MRKIRKGATPNKGFVYFLVGSVQSQMFCKIGFTGGDVAKRARNIGACSPIPLDIFGYVRGNIDLERKFHQTFAPMRMHNEWFAAEFKLHDFVHYLADFGGAQRPATCEELDIAISDVILAKSSSYPAMSDEDYVGSVNMNIWNGYLA